MDILSTLLYSFGLVVTLYFAQRLLRFIYLYTRPSSLPRYHYGPSQPWALVTGASDGIGLGFARELATSNFNVVLHGRNPSKLTAVQRTLETEFPAIHFRTVVCDASTATNKDIADLVSSVKDLHLTVLVNNVGAGVELQPLAETSPDVVDIALNVNARFPAQVTRAFIARFAQSSGRTLILTLGSAGDFLAPYATVYGGSKAFNVAMSASLRIEMRAEGLEEKIEVLGVNVGKVTETARNSEPSSFFTPNSRTMARATLARVGCGLPVVVGECLSNTAVLPLYCASRRFGADASVF